MEIFEKPARNPKLCKKGEKYGIFIRIGGKLIYSWNFLYKYKTESIFDQPTHMPPKPTHILTICHTYATQLTSMPPNLKI